MVLLSPERNKPFKCKAFLLFCPTDWELTESSLYFQAMLYFSHLLVKIVAKKAVVFSSRCLCPD